jgi:hypothetical protein
MKSRAHTEQTENEEEKSNTTSASMRRSATLPGRAGRHRREDLPEELRKYDLQPDDAYHTDDDDA